MKIFYYEGLGEPLGIFKSEQSAMDWAYNRETKQRESWSNNRPEDKKLFQDSFYINYKLTVPEYVEM